MKQVYYSITRTPRRAAILCLTTLGLSYAGIPTASAQQNPGTTYEVSLGNRGARNTVSDTTLTPGPLTSTAAGIEEFFSGAGAAGVGIRPTDGAPGAGFSTLIRGLKSFRGTAEPLFILDGVILNPTTRDAAPAFQNDESDYQAVQNTLASINPNDIEKIEVLKDAASTAIYGSQGANGVIVITTKMGKKGETVRYHSNIGVSTMGHDVEMLPASDYLAMMKQANPGFDAQGGAIDWSGQAVRTAITHSHHISVSGAKDRTRHYLSQGYSGDQGILRRTDQGILNLRANFERTINKNSLIGVRGNFGHVRNNMTQGTSPLGSMSTLKAMTEAAPMRNTVKYGSQLDDTAEGWLSAYDDEANQYFVQQSLYFKAALTEGLTFDVAGGIDYRGKERMRWVGSDVWRGAEEQGRAAKSNIRAIGYNVSAHFAYDRTFGAKHHLTAMLGGTFEGSNSVNHINEGYKFFKEDLRATGIQLAENVQPSHVVRLQSQQTALFASACYTFDNRYTIHAGVRGDYTFRYDNSLDDTALYPWASAAWNIAAEPFMRHAGAISALTLRGGWGRSGRQALNPYLFNESYITGTAPDITIENGITNYYDVRWTGLNDEWNVGLEAGLFNDRIRLTANYYDSRSEDKLRYYYHKRTGDYKEIYANSARILNRGVEVGVQARLIERKEWSWDLGATFSYNRNRILATGAENDGDVFGNSTGEWFGRDVVVNVNRKGESVGAFYGYQSQGIVRERHLLYTPPYNGTRLQEGDIKFIDKDGDGNVTEKDRTVIGNPNPSYRYGLSTRAAWRNLSLTVTMDGAADFDIMNLNLLNTATFATGNYSNLRSDSYRKAYPAGGEPRLNAVGADVVSSRFVEDGSYLRLSNVQVSYRFDIGRKWLRSVDLAFTAKNLCVLTGYSGYSPMVGSYTYDLSRYGVDNGSYPLARTFLLSIKATF